MLNTVNLANLQKYSYPLILLVTEYRSNPNVHTTIRYFYIWKANISREEQEHPVNGTTYHTSYAEKAALSHCAANEHSKQSHPSHGTSTENIRNWIPQIKHFELFFFDLRKLLQCRFPPMSLGNKGMRKDMIMKVLIW